MIDFDYEEAKKKSKARLVEGWCEKHGKIWHYPEMKQKCLACGLEARPDSIKIYELTEEQARQLRGE